MANLIEKNPHTATVRRHSSFGKAMDLSKLKAGDIINLGRETKKGSAGHWGVVGQDVEGNLTLIHAGSEKLGVVEVDLKRYLRNWQAGAKSGTATWGAYRLNEKDRDELKGQKYESGYYDKLDKQYEQQQKSEQ